MAGTIAIEDQKQIEALIYEHAWLVDHGEAHRLHELYTEDGRLLGVGPDKIGKAALAAYGTDRRGQTGRTARHVCTNIRLQPDGAGRVKGTALCTLFRSDGPSIGTADPVAVGEYDDIYVRQPDGRWLILERRMTLVFESEAHRQPPPISPHIPR